MSYSLQYDLDGGNPGEFLPTCAQWNRWPLISAPKRDGYVFVGWQAVGDLTPSAAYSVIPLRAVIVPDGGGPFGGGYPQCSIRNLTTDGGTMTLRAVWEKNLQITGAVDSSGFKGSSSHGSYGFLFSELVKRDFKKKYKRTVLGMGWSMLMPICTLLVLYLIFSRMFGRNILHFPVYIFCGNVLYTWFSDSTRQGMKCFSSNSSIFTKVNVPKHLFLMAKTVQTFINFALTMVVFLSFCLIDGVTFTSKFVLMGYPILTMLVFNFGVGLIISVIYVFFRDFDYLWGVFTMLVMFSSAIFYPVERLSAAMQYVVAWNPVYRHIAYFREVVLLNTVPSLEAHLILASWAIGVLLVGILMYHRFNRKFVYYV